MSNFIVIHIEKRTDIGAGLATHLTRDNFTPDNADPSLSYLNEELIPLEEQSIHDAVFSRIEDAGIKIRKGQNTLLEVIFSGSPEVMNKLSEKQLKAWTYDTMSWAGKEWGKDNIVAAYLHRDEATPHIHMIVVPIVEGESRRTRNYHEIRESNKKKYNIDHSRLRLSANDVFTPKLLGHYWDSYAQSVGAKYGMSRGEHAEPGRIASLKKRMPNFATFNHA